MSGSGVSLSQLITGGLVVFTAQLWADTSMRVIDEKFPRDGAHITKSVMVTALITFVTLIIIYFIAFVGKKVDKVVNDAADSAAKKVTEAVGGSAKAGDGVSSGDPTEGKLGYVTGEGVDDTTKEAFNKAFYMNGVGNLDGMYYIY